MSLDQKSTAPVNKSLERQQETDAVEQSKQWRLVAKIDYQVIPPLCVLYLLAYLDRVNIGNAVLFGLKQDLHLEGNEYNNALVIFFVPYILFEIPSNALLRYFSPHIWRIDSKLQWTVGGAFLFGHVRSYCVPAPYFEDATGLFESAMFPGCAYVISMWYRRDEAQKRYSFFFGSAILAGAFAGLLASAIGKLDGVRDYRGWRWVFLLEGLLTCVVSVVMFFWLPDFPEEVKWLDSAEKSVVQSRLQEDIGDSQTQSKVTFKSAWNIISDPKVLVGGFMYLGLITSAYSFSYFAPTIIQTFGHTSIRSQLLSVPPYASAFVLAMVLAVSSDCLRHRFAFVIAPVLIAVAGLIVLLVVDDDNNLKFGALFMVAGGSSAAIPITISWFTMNFAGHQRRSVAVAWQIGFGNIGGIIASYAFLAKNAPQYTVGYSVCLAFVCLSGIASSVYFVMCLRDNRRRESAMRRGTVSLEEKQLPGDLNPDHRFFL